MKKTLSTRLPLIAIAVAICLFFSCDPGIQSEQIYSVEAETIQVTNSPTAKYYPSWSPDGKMIAFSQYDPGTGLFKYFINTRKTEPLLQEDDAYYDVKLSPDGSKIVYRSGVKKHLWVRSLQDSSDRLLTPAHQAAYSPIWSADGKWSPTIHKIIGPRSEFGSCPQMAALPESSFQMSNPIFVIAFRRTAKKSPCIREEAATSRFGQLT